MGTTSSSSTRSALLPEVRAVVADLPLFMTAPLYRGWHRRWGATSDEVAAAMPGDDLLPGDDSWCTRAITIEAPPEKVWPWLVQVGYGRAGWYADDLLDNGGRPSAAEIRPEFQRLEVGQWVPMSPTPSNATAFKVEAFETNGWLLWRKPDSTWVWVLKDIGHGRTRLLTRIRMVHSWDKPGYALTSMLLAELGDFAMMRRMLLGLKARAEGRPDLGAKDDPSQDYVMLPPFDGPSSHNQGLHT